MQLQMGTAFGPPTAAERSWSGRAGQARPIWNIDGIPPLPEPRLLVLLFISKVRENLPRCPHLFHRHIHPMSCPTTWHRRMRRGRDRQRMVSGFRQDMPCRLCSCFLSRGENGLMLSCPGAHMSKLTQSAAAPGQEQPKTIETQSRRRLPRLVRRRCCYTRHCLRNL